MNASKIVGFYGIHLDDEGVAFLEQGRGSTNAIGLNRKSNFTVKLASGKKHCNHMIPLSSPVPADYHWDYFMTLQDDPLVRAMLPIPKADGGVVFVNDAPDMSTLLILLSKMSSPIHNIVIPAWSVTPQAVLTELNQTNVQPFILSGVEPKHSDNISQIAGAAVYLPRRLVLCGTTDVVLPPSVKRIKTTLIDQKHQLADLLMLPWEQLGAAVVRKFMRKEWTSRG